MGCQTLSMAILRPRASTNALLTANHNDKGVLLVYAHLTYVCACLTEILASERSSKKKFIKKTNRPNHLKLAQNMPKALGYMSIKFG